MRHYFGYRADGALGSIHTFHRGWTADRDVCDANCTDVTVQKLRARMLAKDIVGFVCYECDCPPDKGSCDCVGVTHASSFVKDGVLVAKPLTTQVKIDGSFVDHKERVPRAPGTKVTLQIAAPDVDDGQKVGVFIHGAVLALSDQHELTVTGGVSETLELTAPAQGSAGTVMIGGIQVRTLAFDLLGFA
jgi:hypothetical protein